MAACNAAVPQLTPVPGSDPRHRVACFVATAQWRPQHDRDAACASANLRKHFDVRLGAFGERGARVHALDDFTVDIVEGETLSLVGESGCGKSTTGFAILNLHRPTGGTVIYKGTDIAKLDEDGDAPVPPRSADRVPGPLFDAEPPHDHRRGVGRTDPVPQAGHQGGTARAG